VKSNDGVYFVLKNPVLKTRVFIIMYSFVEKVQDFHRECFYCSAPLTSGMLFVFLKLTIPLKGGEVCKRGGHFPLNTNDSKHMTKFLKGDLNMTRNIFILTILGGMLFLAACATTGSIPAVDTGSSEPGGSVTFKGKSMNLLGNPIAIGKPLPSVKLTESGSMKMVDLSQEKGNVLFLSIVPSLDTKVCEAQTHYLGEKGKKMPADIQRITVSRDTPFAQVRFEKESKLKNIRYLSDYREGQFGLANGLLIDDLRLLARTIVIVDKAGIVRYIQVVPEITHLPDMEKAFAAAADISR
jgi:thiol peroxidase